jgi:integrase
MPKIGKRAIDELIAAGVPKVVRDSELPGFQARLNVDGTVVFLLEYRAGAGGRASPKRRFKIGSLIDLTPDQARREAERVRGAIRNGDDPAGRQTAKRKELTVGQWLDRCVAEHWQAKRKASTARAFKEMIDRTLKPEFGPIKLSDLSRAHVRAWHAKQTHRARQANLDLAILRKAMSLAVADDLIPANPVAGISKHPERVRDRVPSDNEMAALWKAIGDTDIRTTSRLLFRLLALTGCRRDEVRAARWEWVDLHAGLLRLPDAKAGARNVPLPSIAAELLARETRRGEWLIGNDAGDAPLSPSRVHGDWVSVCSAAGINDLRIHDLRHGFATRGATMGANSLVLRDALGHKSLAMTSRYVARQIDPVRDLSNRIANQIANLGSRPDPPATVPLRKRSRT